MENKKNLLKYENFEIQELTSYIIYIAKKELKERFPSVDILNIELDLFDDSSFFSHTLLVDKEHEKYLNAFKFNIYLSNIGTVEKKDLNFGLIKLSNIYIQDEENNNLRFFSYKEDIKTSILNIKNNFKNTISMNLKTYISPENFFIYKSLQPNSFDLFINHEQDISILGLTDQYLKDPLFSNMRINYFKYPIIFKNNFAKLFDKKILEDNAKKNKINIDKIDNISKKKIIKYSNNSYYRIYFINNEV